jgi:hypothetical protein
MTRMPSSEANESTRRGFAVNIRLSIDNDAMEDRGSSNDEGPRTNASLVSVAVTMIAVVQRKSSYIASFLVCFQSTTRSYLLRSHSRLVRQTRAHVDGRPKRGLPPVKKSK